LTSAGRLKKFFFTFCDNALSGSKGVFTTMLKEATEKLTLLKERTLQNRRYL